MKKKTVTHKNLNDGKPTDIYYCQTEEELDMQIDEIFDKQDYKEALGKESVVDLGANIGLVALYLKDAKKYWAVEPNPQIYECLVENTKSLPHVKAFNFGITHENGFFDMLQTDPNSPAQTFMRPERPVISGIKAEVKSIDTFFNENGIHECDILKIDVEGSEYYIFLSEGFEKMAPRIKSIVGEAHFVHTVSEPAFIPQILQDLGYSCEWKPRFNMYKYLTYKDKKKYEVGYNTIFYAKRS